ncbi:LRR receptor-like kinase [Trifolium medium]|uniref:LRR receptor-like kinase n=1 Tax=Trifolium medium TaxID=97028 RepID=A0A392P3E9_9FABA|nr:LRR receptor-like kinase [Trifolium medium]MCI06581.1 LRR receptor-like kinase [Trifolium medium]
MSIVYLENALKDIAKSLGKKDWNFDIDPCSSKSNWVIPSTDPPRLRIVVSNVSCNCFVPGDNFCHVVSM